ncbi:helix-turn-helix domain-containing protein [Streptomyces sp. NPDC059063]|uniref:helix-turn-helix domain-containing protein n=1 Tax=unclassified Streptomyces TaxID=2593676 RepID=UPI00367F9B4A
MSTANGTDADRPLECVRLATELREVKQRAGLSLATLARRTPYSKSSWARYLNGEQQPPKRAVVTLCEVAQAPPERLLALWGLADHAWSGRARSTPVASASVASTPVPAPEPSAAADVRRSRRRWRAALAGGGVAAAVAVTLAVVLSSGATTGRQETKVGSTGPSVYYDVGCRDKACEGKDPLAMGCGKAGIVASPLVRQAPGGQRVEIRHSAKCGAVWARGMNLRVGDRIELSLPGARTKRVVARDPDGYVATPMTAARSPKRAEVCLIPAAVGGAGGGGGRVCFGP